MLGKRPAHLLRVSTQLAVIGAMVFVAACSPAAAPTIKIASQSPLSGKQASLGTAIKNGAALAVKQLSKSITDLGFKVEFVPFDDQATPDVGVANAQNIVNDASILAVVGHLNSGVAIPSSEVYAKSDLAMVSPANTNPKVTDRDSTHLITNRVCGRDDIQGPVGAKYVATVLNAKTVYVITDKTAYGDGVGNAFADAVKGMGVQVLGNQATEEGSNFDAILTPIAALNPDVIYYGGIYDKGAVLFKQAREKGIKSQLFGADGLDSSDLVKIAGDASVGFIFTTTAGPSTLFPDAKQFITDFEAEYKVDQVETYAPEAYASTQVVIAGITKAIKDNGGKLPTRKQVAAAIRATSGLKTVVGTLTFDANGDPQIASYYIEKVVSSDVALYGTTGKSPLQILTFPSPLTAAASAPAAAGTAAAAPAAATMAATP